MEKRRLLLVDAGEDFSRSLAQPLHADYQVRLCQNGLEALELVQEFQPHVLVLELMLPGLDGISLLEELSARGPLPITVVVTRYCNDYSLQVLTRLKVGYTILKPCDIRATAERIRDLDAQMSQSPSDAADLPQRAAQILLSLGFSPKHRGFGYLRDALVMAVHEPGISVTKEVYPAVAAIGNDGTSNVEHAIRTAIESACRKGDKALWVRYFAPGSGELISRPTNATFLNRIAQVLRSAF